MRESLEKINTFADVIVVSATPIEALEREWAEAKLDSLVKFIAGQEMGKKKDHLAIAAQGKYPSDKILMVGDAPGDFRSAKAVDALFYPVMPGKEDESWERFLNEALDVFKAGKYAGAYEENLIKEFDDCLASTPPWKK